MIFNRNKQYNSRRTTGATWHTPPVQRSQKRDGQTDRQKNSTFLAIPAAGEILAPPNLAW